MMNLNNVIARSLQRFEVYEQKLIDTAHQNGYQDGHQRGFVSGAFFGSGLAYLAYSIRQLPAAYSAAGLIANSYWATGARHLVIGELVAPTLQVTPGVIGIPIAETASDVVAGIPVMAGVGEAPLTFGAVAPLLYPPVFGVYGLLALSFGFLHAGHVI